MARTSFVDVPAPDTYLERFDDCGMRLWKFDRGPTFRGSFFFFLHFCRGQNPLKNLGEMFQFQGGRNF